MADGAARLRKAFRRHAPVLPPHDVRALDHRDTISCWTAAAYPRATPSVVRRLWTRLRDARLPRPQSRVPHRWASGFRLEDHDGARRAVGYRGLYESGIGRGISGDHVSAARSLPR